MAETSDLIPRLAVDATDFCRREIRGATVWLNDAQGEDAARRFAQVLADTTIQLAESLADRQITGLPQADEAASRAGGFSVWMQIMRTGRGRARPRASAWRVYDALPDTNRDGVPDLLLLVSVRHAAAQPYGQP